MIGHNAGSGRIRSLFERWHRLEADKQAIADDLKELFSEAKGEGFNTKALRAVFRDKAKLESEDAADTVNREEFEAVCDLYRAALEGPRAHPAPARVENIEEIPLPTSSPEAELPEPSSPAEASAGVEPPPSAPAEDFEPPAFLVKAKEPLRPNCLNPDLCAGSGREHCHACKKALAATTPHPQPDAAARAGA